MFCLVLVYIPIMHVCSIPGNVNVSMCVARTEVKILLYTCPQIVGTYWKLGMVIVYMYMEIQVRPTSCLTSHYPTGPP